jgi:sulfofructose kinase
LAVALGEGAADEDALRFAAAAAALKCLQPGGIAGAPRRESVEALVSGRSATA